MPRVVRRSMLTLLLCILPVFIGLAYYSYAHGHIGNVGLTLVVLVVATLGLLLLFGGMIGEMGALKFYLLSHGP
jgi:hypothetical protein